MHQQPQTLSWSLCGDVFVIAQSDVSPTDHDYDDALAGYRRHLGDYRSILISTRGGRVNALQRKRTTDFWEEMAATGAALPKTAVMASKKTDRAVLTGMNWFLSGDVRIKPFAFDDFDGAFAYLGVFGLDQARVRTVLDRLHEQLCATAVGA